MAAPADSPATKMRWRYINALCRRRRHGRTRLLEITEGTIAEAFQDESFDEYMRLQRIRSASARRTG